MSSELNRATTITEFESFLNRMGLRLEHSEESASFGDKLFRYAGEVLAVRVVSDKGIWFVEIKSVEAADTQWFDAAIIREIVLGPPVEDVMSLDQQINFIEEYWPAIVRRFDPSNWRRTAARLSSLGPERTMRRLPGLFAPPVIIN